MEEQKSCAICGRACATEEVRSFDGRLLCPECLEEQTVLCCYCGVRIWRADNAGTEAIPLCQTCCDDHYFHCCGCGALTHEANTYYNDSDEYAEYPLCPGCYEAQSRGNPIHDYYYMPAWREQDFADAKHFFEIKYPVFQIYYQMTGRDHHLLLEEMSPDNRNACCATIKNFLNWLITNTLQHAYNPNTPMREELRKDLKSFRKKARSGTFRSARDNGTREKPQ